MRPLFAIFSKELLDGVRDRRSLFSALIFPISCALILGLLMNTIAGIDGGSEPVKLPVVGAEYAPDLVAALEQAGIEVLPGPEDPKAAVAEGEALVLVIPSDFEERVRQGRSVPLRLVRDRSRPEDSAPAKQVQAALGAWAGQLAAMRLMARGVSPELVQPLAISTVDLSTPASKASSLVDVVTMLLVLACFFCNMYLAIDATAGERERNSLEALLLNPVRAEVLVLGKFGATVVFGAVGVAGTLGLITLAMLFVPMEQIAMRIEVGRAAPAVLALLLPATLLAGALQLLVASGSRSFKEAQIALSMALFVPMMPGLLLSLKPTETAEWMQAVPVLGHQILVTDLITGEPVSGAMAGALVLSSLAVTALLLLATAALYKREAILFGR